MHTLSTSTLDKAPIEASTATSSLGSRLKYALLFTGAQCSFFIGAGIATGQESLQYFTAHGWWGIVSIVLVVLLFSWLLSSLTEWGRKNRDNKADPFTDICGKTVGTVLRYCVPVFVFMIAVTMFAGAGALLSDVLGTPTWVGATGMAVVVAITLMFGFRNLVEIIGRIGPVIVIVIGIVALWVVVENFAALADVPENLAQYQPAKASENWFIGTILYSTAILIIAVPFLTSLGREDRSLRSTVRPSILTGFLSLWRRGQGPSSALALRATLPAGLWRGRRHGHARHRPLAPVELGCVVLTASPCWASTHRKCPPCCDRAPEPVPAEVPPHLCHCLPSANRRRTHWRFEAAFR